jgi:glutathione S-transferase
MLTLYFTPGACSMAAHIVLEESGEKYEPRQVDLANGEQRTEAYLKINPQGRVPVLRLDGGEHLAENTAILPYLGKRFGLWPTEPVAEAKALSLIGFFAASVHPAHAHVGRPERYAADQSAFPTIKEIDGLVAREAFAEASERLVVKRGAMPSGVAVIDGLLPALCDDPRRLRSDNSRHFISLRHPRSTHPDTVHALGSPPANQCVRLAPPACLGNPDFIAVGNCKQHPLDNLYTCVYRKSDSAILVKKAAKDRS